jgi:hypothetical protein
VFAVRMHGDTGEGMGATVTLGQWIKDIVLVVRHAVDTKKIEEDHGRQLLSVGIALVEAFEGARELCIQSGRCRR